MAIHLTHALVDGDSDPLDMRPQGFMRNLLERLEIKPVRKRKLVQLCRQMFHLQDGVHSPNGQIDIRAREWVPVAREPKSRTSRTSG